MVSVPESPYMDNYQWNFRPSTGAVGFLELCYRVHARRPLCCAVNMVTWSLISQLTPCARANAAHSSSARADSSRECMYTHKGAVVLLTLRSREEEVSHVHVLFKCDERPAAPNTYHHCLAQQTRARDRQAKIYNIIVFSLRMFYATCSCMQVCARSVRRRSYGYRSRMKNARELRNCGESLWRPTFQSVEEKFKSFVISLHC